jgi:double zinc ribbon protein
MSPTRCPFCEHDNPADARFCSECGGALHLAPCPKCGAVNQVTASVCYQCRSQLRGHGTADAPAPPVSADAFTESLANTFVSESLPVAVVPKSLPRRRSQVIAGTVVVVVIVALGYNAYRQRSHQEELRPQTASSEAAARSAPGGTAGRNAMTGAAGPAVVGAGAGPAAAAVLPSGNAPAVPTHGVLDQSRASRPPAESQKARPAAVAATRSRATSAGTTGEPRPGRSDACAGGVAALGLCGVIAAQGNDAQRAVAAEAQARPQAPDADKAGKSQPPRLQACAEGVAALGLCPPDTLQRR